MLATPPRPALRHAQCESLNQNYGYITEAHVNPLM